MSFSTENQLKQCRICLDSENPNDLISPCFCSGGSAYVHRQCLNHWRSQNARGIGFKCCDICQFEYIIENVMDDTVSERKRLIKYNLFVIRDLLGITLFIQIIILLLAYLLKLIDKNGQNIKNLYPDSVNGFLVYYLSSCILLLALIGFIALIAICCASARSGTSSNFGSIGNSCTGGGKGCLAAMFSIIVICAIIGVIIGIIFSVIILKKIMTHHTNRIWLRQEADKYIVKDFQGIRHELDKYKKNNRT